MPAEIINKWKEALIALTGLIVVVLQIVNVFLANDIDYNLGHKATQLQEKQAALEALLEKQAAALQTNGEVSRGNSKVVSDTNAIVHELDKQVTGIGKTLDNHVQSAKQLGDMLRAMDGPRGSPTPNPTPP